MGYGTGAYGDGAFGGTAFGGSDGPTEGPQTMAVGDYTREKPLTVASATGTPTVSKAQPLYITSGDDQTTGTGQVVIDWTNVSAESDIAVYDDSDSLLSYEIEDFDATAETALLWVYNDWVRDGTEQAKLVFGNGPVSSEEGSAAGVWGNTGQGTAGVWHLNESSGDALDSSGNGNDGQVNGPTQGVTGEFADGYDFNAANTDEVAVSDDAAFDITSSLTVAMWINPDTFTGTGSNSGKPLSKRDGWQSSNPYEVGRNSNEIDIRVQDGTQNDSLSATLASTDQWYSVVLVFDGSDLYLYLDGSQADTTSHTNALPTNDVDLTFGTLPGGNAEPFDGQLDNIRLYSASNGADWASAEYDASAEGSQTFFSQGAAGNTGGASATASITTQDADQSTTTGNRQVTATVTAQDADTATVTGTRQANATLSTQDADTSTVAGLTGTAQIASLSSQDGDTATVAGARAVLSTPSTQDADTATATGLLGQDAVLSTQDADMATATGARQADSSLSTQDADSATLAGLQGAAASILAPATLTLTWDDADTHKLTWDDSETVQITMANNTITQQIVPATGENIERTIEVVEDGSDKDISGATVEWYLLPDGDSADGDAIIDHTTTGVNLSISDADAGEVTLSVDQGVTDGLSGRYYQRLKVDDSGPGLQMWGGAFSIETV